MLEALRKSTGSWLAKIFIGLLVLSFAVWGVADIFGGYGTRTVATVGDIKISAEEYQLELQRELRSLGRRADRTITMEDARNLGIDQQVLLRMIGDAALRNEAQSLTLGITDQAIAATIRNDPAFQDSSGRFNQQIFVQLLRSNGLSEEAYVARQRQSSVLQQMTGTITASEALPTTLLAARNRFQNETRRLSYFTLPVSQFPPLDEPTPEELRNYYDTHKGEFRTPEYRKVGLIALTPDRVAESIQIGDDQLKAYFESYKDRFQKPERRIVQQIPFPDTAAARKAYERIRGGAGFMEVAEERGLAEEDMNLGTVSKNQLADSKIADAAFALEEGEVSEPVSGTLTTALLRVTEIQPGEEKSFEDVKAQIHETMARERAANDILDFYDKIEDERAAGATLAEAAAKLNLDYVEVDAVNQQGRNREGEPVEALANNPQALQAVFQTDVGVETDPVETSDQGYIWTDALGVTPEQVRPFEEVRGQVEDNWRTAQQRSRLADKGKELVAELRQGESLETVAAEFDAEVKQSAPLKREASNAEVPRAAVAQAFALSEGDYGSAAAGDDARVIFQVAEATRPSLPENAADERFADRLASNVNDDLLVQYVRALRERYGVEINQKAVDQVTGRES